MAKILGIQAYSFNQAAALCDGGDLKAFIEDEKVSRVKGEKGNFPKSSVDYCLKEGRLKMDEIDEVVLPWNPKVLFWTAVKFGLRGQFQGMFTAPSPAARHIPPVSLFYDRFLVLIKHSPLFMKNLTYHHLRFSHQALKLPKVSFVPHHRSHAASVFYTSGFEEAAVIVVDGLGDRESTTIWKGQGLELKQLDEIRFPNSLGEFYAAMTQFLGFHPYSHEGKLMGLAAFGKKDPDIFEKMKKVLHVFNEGYEVNWKYTVGGSHRFGTYYSDQLVELFGPPRQSKEEFTDFHYNLAFAAQDFLEQAMKEIVKKAVRLTGCKRVCLAGGVAMNCKMNGVVLHMDEVDELFVIPAANDAGAAMGAAFVKAIEHGDDPRFQLKHTYYGPGYSDQEIAEALQLSGIPYSKIDSLDSVADDLIEGKVLGLFHGRMEFGARALGARSIIANPMIPGMKDKVNLKVKFREKWRPFAPVILAGHEDQYFESGEVSRYMMKAFKSKEVAKKVVPEIVHVDDTARPQTAEQDTNPVYFGILKAFHEKTGVPVLLNTSFNLREEPIVCTPQDAIRTFWSSGMDCLLMGSCYVRKEAVLQVAPMRDLKKPQVVSEQLTH